MQVCLGNIKTGRLNVLAFILVLALTIWPHESWAQGPDNPLLDTLIQGLEALQEGGPTEPGGIGIGNLPERSGQADSQRQGRGSRHTLTPTERFLVNEFCEGRTNATDEKVLLLLTKFSDLEADFCTRAGQLLLQFGYEIFDGPIDPQVLLNGAIQDDYVLGIGDEILVTFHGLESGTQRAVIDREGRLILRDLAPIPAVGRTFGELKRVLGSITSEAFIGTEVFVSLGAVRQIAVLVLGEVLDPGVHRLTGLSTIIDAVRLAGGISKTGSLRKVHVSRKNEIYWVDFYDLLFTFGQLEDMTLVEGDRIIVPPIGDTVAVAGFVKRPGIYELAEGQASLSSNEALILAAGPVRPRGNTLVVATFDSVGHELIAEDVDAGTRIGGGDILLVQRRENIRLGQVDLLGHVRVSGRRALRSAPTIKSLLHDANSLKDDPYLPLAVLQTRDPATLSRRFFPINVQNILDGLEDFILRDGDRLIILSRNDVRYLSSTDVQSVIARNTEALLLAERDKDEDPALPLPTSVISAVAARAGALESLEGISQQLGLNAVDLAAADEASEPSATLQGRGLKCRSLQDLSKLVADVRAERFASALLIREDFAGAVTPVALPCREIFEAYADLLPFLLEHAAVITGEVRRPGIYPVVAETPLSSLIAVTGGLSREVDLSRVEVTRFIEGGRYGTATDRSIVDLVTSGIDSVSVNSGDVVRFNSVFTDRDSGPIFLAGEFVRPGSYDIRRGERLSQVIARAGGVTGQAYPFGAVFTRESIRRAEALALQRLSRELNSALYVAAANQGLDPAALQAIAKLTGEVEAASAVGRLVIEADPTVLQVRTELDIVLEPGDRVFMPKRPNSVLVTGDVLNPGAMQFNPGMKVDKYIRQAGGFQRGADEDRLFIIFPNGVAQPVSVSAFNYTPVQVPPGSTIVVPKDPTPLNLFTFTRELATVLSQLAITAASLAVIGGN
jgi:protein involved in polysaccharide export with SLBB domain